LISKAGGSRGTWENVSRAVESSGGTGRQARRHNPYEAAGAARTPLWEKPLCGPVSSGGAFRPEGRMVSACILALSMPAAEVALAELWLQVAWHGLQSPEIRLEFAERGQIILCATFIDRPRSACALQAWTSGILSKRYGAEGAEACPAPGRQPIRRGGTLPGWPARKALAFTMGRGGPQARAVSQTAHRTCPPWKNDR